MTKKTYLVLDDGTYYEGCSFGNEEYVEGEIVFNTTMDSYESVMKNPAYFNKILVFTYPLIGNLGISLEEKERCYPIAVVAKEVSKVPLQDNKKELLDTFLTKNSIVGVECIDTRMITRAITKGNKKAFITTSNFTKDKLADLSKKIEDSNEKELICEVSTKEEYTLGDAKKHIGVLDFGVEQSLLKFLVKLGYKITVFPYNTSETTLLSKKLDLLLLSDGPGNPNSSKEVISTVKKLIGKIPMIGVSFGNSIISLALDFKIDRLKVGHFSDSQTIVNQKTKKIVSTIQNHLYNVDENSIKDVEITYKNFNDESIEGYKDTKNKIITTNFFPKHTDDPILAEIFEYL